MAAEYYVVGDDKSLADAYKKNDLYNKDEIDAKFNDIDVDAKIEQLNLDGRFGAIQQSIGTKADSSDLEALSNTVNSKIDATALNAALSGYAPVSRKINTKDLRNDVSLTYLDVGAAPSTHDHKNTYASLIASTFSNKDQSASITLPPMDIGSWLVFDCRTTATDGGSNNLSNRRSIKLPGNSNDRYMLITSHSTQDSVHEDIQSGVYPGGREFDNKYWNGTYDVYDGATYLNGVLLRIV